MSLPIFIKFIRIWTVKTNLNFENRTWVIYELKLKKKKKKKKNEFL